MLRWCNACPRSRAGPRSQLSASDNLGRKRFCCSLALCLHCITLFSTALSLQRRAAAQEAWGYLRGRELALGGILWDLLASPGVTPPAQGCALCYHSPHSSSANWGLGRGTPEWDMLKLLDVKHRVGLWVSKAWPEVTGSLMDCTKTDVPMPDTEGFMSLFLLPADLLAISNPAKSVRQSLGLGRWSSPTSTSKTLGMTWMTTDCRKYSPSLVSTVVEAKYPRV